MQVATYLLCWQSMCWPNQSVTMTRQRQPTYRMNRRGGNRRPTFKNPKASSPFHIDVEVVEECNDDEDVVVNDNERRDEDVNEDEELIDNVNESTDEFSLQSSC